MTLLSSTLVTDAELPAGRASAVARAGRGTLALAPGIASAAALVALLLLQPAPLWSSVLLTLCIVAFVGAAAVAARAAHGSQRTLLSTLAVATAVTLVARVLLGMELLQGGPAHVLSPNLLVYLFAAHPILLIGLAATLGLRRPRAMQLEVALDALLLVAAAVIVNLLLPYGAVDQAVHGDAGTKFAFLVWRIATAAELGLVALLLAWRGETLGVRAGLGLAVGSVAFAVGNTVYGQALVAPGADASTTADPYFLVAIFALSFTLAPARAAAVHTTGEGAVRKPEPTPQVVDVSLVPDESHADRRTTRRELQTLRGISVVLAILISSASALVLGFQRRPHPALGVAVALFGMLGAVRIAHALWLQRRETRRLTSSVTAERELSALLEQRVAARTAELADAQRVQQRMWELGQHVTFELHPARVLHHFMEAVLDVTRADGGAVGLIADKGQLRIAAGAGSLAGLQGRQLPLESDLMARVVRHGRGWRHADVTSDSTVHTAFAAALGDDIDVRGVLLVPVHRRGERIGALAVITSTPRQFTDVDVARAESLTDMLSVALANADLVETLRQAEWRFRTLFRAAPDAVLTVLRSGRVREANDAVRELTGLDPVQVVGRDLSALARDEDRARLDDALAGAFDGRPARLEVRVRRTSAAGGGVPDETRLVSIAASRLPEAEPPTVLVLARDITSEREMRARLAETERLAATGELVAGVAHEVNNPLSSISAYAQLLLRDPRLTDADHRESIEVIRAETTRASQVVKDLLAFARRSEPRREAADLTDVVERTLRLRGYQLTASDVHVRLELAPDLPPVVGDARQLQQVVLNLVTNAIQAMAPAGRGTLRLTTRSAATPQGAAVQLEIADTGPGIPPELRARVFEPFFTTKPEGEGTGLGLSVSYGIVAAHGGTLALAESSSGGTTFVVTLPAGGEHGPAASVHAARISGGLGVPAPMLPAGLPAPRSPLAGLRVLFVDDEASLRSGMEAFGRLRGFEVTTAESGAAALVAVQATSFDAVVCDLRMPGMSGPAFHEQLARERPGLARRTVFITGDVLGNGGGGGGGSPGRGTPGRTGVRQPTLAKPFTFERLEQTVLAVMRHG